MESKWHQVLYAMNLIFVKIIIIQWNRTKVLKISISEFVTSISLVRL